MRLTLKHVEKTKSGSWQYRRRVPKAVAAVITKREFKAKLGDSEKAALSAWHNVHTRVERKIAAAQRRIAQGMAVSSGLGTDLEAYEEAARRVSALAAIGATHRELTHEANAIAASYPQDPETDDPRGASKLDEYTINLMRLGSQKVPVPAPTLLDALALYLKERLDSENPATDSRAVGLPVRHRRGGPSSFVTCTARSARPP